MLLIFMRGGNGLQYYKVQEAYSQNPGYYEYPICAEEYHLKKSALFDALKLVNKDYPILQALVWGRRTNPKPITVTPIGDTEYSWGINNTSPCNDRESGSLIRSVDLQFKNRRYIVIVNSAPTRAGIAWWNANPNGVTQYANNPAVANANCPAGYRDFWAKNSIYVNKPPTPPQYEITCTISGLKFADGTEDQLVVRNAQTGALVPVDGNGEISVTLDPLESVVYVVEPADGYQN